MKHTTSIKKILSTLLLGATTILGGCTVTKANTSNSDTASLLTVEAAASAAASTADSADSISQQPNADANKQEKEDEEAEKTEGAVRAVEKEGAPEYNVSEDTQTTSQQTIPWTYNYTADDIPEWNGEDPYIVINDNNPFFPEDYYTEISFETYSELDELGRCQSVCANIGLDLMPTETRTSISEVTPSGWNQKEYDSELIPGSWLYNRGHLIGFQLTAENANKRNLITASKFLNNTGMLPFENMVADYIKETGNHVLYRSTPLFDGDNLVAKAVLLEAKSVEDNGEGICFNVLCYNVQPGITIDYSTGESWISNTEDRLEETTDYTSTEAKVEARTATTEVDDNDDDDEKENDSCCYIAADQTTTYILNTSTHKIHDSNCSYTASMTDENKEYSNSTLEELLEDGYTLCSRCLGK